ncbi:MULTISPECIES: DUF4148 domain-containing protein [Paraburkholderia]|uniref:Uncharacterized protein DUF4148 n=1 Tax=Paraburkholderia tropica TaxID=92647 RepID=A0ABX5MEB6_9BURK|nr:MULTISPECIES: DUF4148 domain-containing protein [Paraburkholderia]MBB2984611.1 hypothetical protein [Paraburkholderia tropica]MBB3005262.1 hypothetical protein [Paraburkholderia tropica]MBB6324183.1 hypothetical protein [Paraburkholderia tropica]MDE1140423.1 DUF4148 domain-containing protein [Paraburkholderia tropica]OBR54683.1 hypothetical protein A6456_36760 [Paraburkholderia tropica]
MKKSWKGAAAALMVSMSALAHAQASAPAAANAPVQQTSASANASWNAGGTAPVTRAQVRRELVQAQQDGELKTLNSTIYAHH